MSSTAPGSLSADDLYVCIAECLGDDATGILKRWRRLLPEKLVPASLPQIVRTELTGGECLLLQSAMHTRGLPESQRTALLVLLLDKFVELYRGTFGEELASQVKSRIDVIRMLLASCDNGPSASDSLQGSTLIPGTSGLKSGVESAREFQRITLERAIETTNQSWQWKATERCCRQIARDFPELQTTGQSVSEYSAGKQVRGPAFLHGDIPELTKQVFAETAEKYSANAAWMNPGLLMAGDLMSRFLGTARQPNAVVKTWILFAIPALERGLVVRLTMERLPDGCGMLIPSASTCGFLSMDAAFSTGLQNAWLAVCKMYPNEYEGGLNFDWRWSLDLRLPPPVDWYLNIQRRMQLPLAGSSAEAAFACAMLALHPAHPSSYDAEGSNPLDAYSAITAQLDFESSDDPGRAHELKKDDCFLTGVRSLGLKTKFLNSLESCVIHDVAIAENHSPEDIPDDREKGFRFPKALTLRNAWEELTRWQRITRIIKKGIHREASLLLQERQHSLIFDERTDDASDIPPYVRSPLRQVFSNLPLRPSKEKPGQFEVPYNQLSIQELEEFELGRWTPHSKPHPESLDSTVDESVDKDETEAAAVSTSEVAGVREQASRSVQPDVVHGARIWLHADSGMGKSMLMIACEKSIAGAPDSRIPLRVGMGRLRRTGEGNVQDGFSLSEITWTASPNDLKIELINKLLARYCPKESVGVANNDEHQKTLLEWLSRALECRSVSFLFDALDQTLKKTASDLKGFLNQEEILKCQVIVTGRPEALTNMNAVFGSHGSLARHATHWTHVELCEFGPEEQKTFLGEPIATELMTELTDPRHDTSKEDLRRLMWKPLLGIPMLISLMRTMATSKDPSVRRLDDISNRFELYQHAVQCLIAKGSSITERLSKVGTDYLTIELNEVLGEIAFSAAVKHNFTGQFSGNVYYAIQQRRRDQLLSMDELFQLDMVTSLIDRSGKNAGLEWRHRSLMDYYAAVYLTLTRADARHASAWNSPEVACVQDSERRKLFCEIHHTDETCDPSQELQKSRVRDKDPKDMDRVSDWQWTLRFALCYAAKSGQHDVLAIELLQHGNPWVVYETIDQDGLEYNDSVEILVRWLVHRDWTYKCNFCDALQRTHQPDVTEAAAVVALFTVFESCPSLINDMLKPATRDASYVDPLLDLLSAKSGKPRWGGGVDFQPSVEETRLELPWVYLRCQKTDTINRLKKFVDDFVKLPNGNFSPSEFHSVSALRNMGLQIESRNGQEIAVPIAMQGLRMSSFFVTNEVFELYSTAHRRWRNRYSHQADQPAVYVSWNMARAFTEWMTHLLADEPGYGGLYRLPTEWEWEWAIRWWNDETKKFQHNGSYWWGDSDINGAAWVAKGDDGHEYHTRSLRRSKENHTSLVARTIRHASWEISNGVVHRGLIDPVGNVWSWCGNRYESSGVWRSVRGSSFYDVNREFDESSYRLNNTPGRRSGNVGFRVVRDCLSLESSLGFSG